MNTTKMLKKNYEFKNVLSKGTFYPQKYISAVIKENNKNYNMLGLAISAKIGKAVIRNRIKRILRENYNYFEKHIKIGFSIVFLCNKNIDVNDVTFSNIKCDMNNIFDKANLKIGKCNNE